ncbi:MAG: type IV pilus secretin PilQ [Desulfovibrionaceae bacterium]
MKSAYWIVLLLAMALAATNCSSKNEHVAEYDEAIEKWKVMAEQSPGHSPSNDLRPENVQQTLIQAEPIDAAKPEVERPLPQFKISLRMHDADLVAVLQALSRAARQSIVVSPSVQGTVNINIVQTPWAQVFKGVLAANKLTFSWEGDILRVMTMEDVKFDLDLDVLRKQQQQEKLAMQQVEAFATSIVRVRYADAAALQPGLLTFLSKNDKGEAMGTIQVDASSNALIIQALRKDMDKIVNIIAHLDAPRAQIKLKAHIVETTTDTARALGFQWGGYYKGKSGVNNRNLYLMPSGDTGESTTTIVDGALPEYNPTLGTTSAGNGMGINLLPGSLTGSTAGAGFGLLFGNLGENILELQLRALEEDNKLKIISSPSITTMDNQKAYTESGERVPYQTTETSGGTITTSVEFQDVVLRLEITPHIIDNDYLKLSVLIKKDEVDTSRDVDGNPFIIKKETETTLIARDGETVVISGLSKQKDSYTDDKVPGLGDIPALGRLFSSTDRSNYYDEFLIFITPTVLSEWQPGERQKTMEEIEQEMQERKAREAAAKQESEDGNADGGAGPATEQQP